MEILGVGASELVFILILALIILGPRDMQKAGRTIGKWLRSIVTSDGWKVFQQTSRELRTLPNRLMREANEELKDVREIGKELKNTADQLNNANPKIGHTPTSYRPMPINPPPLPPLEKNEPTVTETQANESDSKANA